ncbi:hypothetical protein DL93DRAFT_2159022 [Clavulina sp. PMI_390]|nr:hypothetical protein DL93DRAFT_2159022 [Clavulina sp. PMI_390]
MGKPINHPEPVERVLGASEKHFRRIKLGLCVLIESIGLGHGICLTTIEKGRETSVITTDPHEYQAPQGFISMANGDEQQARHTAPNEPAGNMAFRAFGAFTGMRDTAEWSELEPAKKFHQHSLELWYSVQRPGAQYSIMSDQTCIMKIKQLSVSSVHLLACYAPQESAGATTALSNRLSWLSSTVWPNKGWHYLGTAHLGNCPLDEEVPAAFPLTFGPHRMGWLSLSA